MPTYAYACKDCSHEFDIVQSFNDDSLTRCPECEGALRKKFNSVGVVFKGSGFYRNDSRKDGSGRTGSGSSTTASSGSGDTAGSGASSTGSGGSGASSNGSGSSSSSSNTSGSSSPAPAKTPAGASA